MDLLRLGEKGIFLSQRRRKWLIFMAITGVSGYGAYKVYHLPSVARKRKRLLKLLGAIVSVAELISDSAETFSIVSRDLKGFLNSDSDEIPNSLKQIAKIAKSNEFTDSLSRVSQAVTIGVFRGYNFESSSNNVNDSGIGESESSVVDRVIEKVFSKAGSGFVSAVVGSFAKNLILGFYSDELESGVRCESSDSSETPRWVNLLCDDKCRELLSDCIERFTSTAVAVYLDKTMDINTYDQIFEGMTNPQHQDSVKDVLVSVCNGALETVVRTSHEVFTSSKSNNKIEEMEDDDFKSNGLSRSKIVSESGDGIKSNGWAEAISTTLAVPSNRRFMFDVTGRVTLETTRSIIAFIMLKTFQGFRTGINVVHEEVTDKGRQAVEYVGAKSSVILTVCLALYLHVISGCVRNSPTGVSQHF